jgi:hypothetical protein
MKPTKTMLTIQTPMTYLAEAAHALSVPTTSNRAAGLRRGEFDPAFARRPAR